MALEGQAVAEESTGCRVRWSAVAGVILAALLLAPGASRAAGFPHIPVWAFPGGFEDGSHFKPDSCVGKLTAAGRQHHRAAARDHGALPARSPRRGASGLRRLPHVARRQFARHLAHGR